MRLPRPMLPLALIAACGPPADLSAVDWSDARCTNRRVEAWNREGTLRLEVSLPREDLTRDPEAPGVRYTDEGAFDAGIARAVLRVGRNLDYPLPCTDHAGWDEERPPVSRQRWEAVSGRWRRVVYDDFAPIDLVFADVRFSSEDGRGPERVFDGALTHVDGPRQVGLLIRDAATP